MTAVAAVAHSARAVDDHLGAIAAWCERHGVDFWVGPDEEAGAGHGGRRDERPLGEADLVLSLGGDGTMLRSVHLLDGAPTPLLGVNLGSLGYLTEVEPDHLESALDRFFHDTDWQLDERLMVDVEVGGERVGRALNEAVVEKHRAGHTVRLLARIDGEPFTSYVADGLIVATPTGSTAYSLSARGPIVSPRHRALLLTPVSPHMLFDRTLVLDPTQDIEVEVCGHRSADLALDGRFVQTLGDGEVVRCTSSTATARFVRFGDLHFHRILKSKFGLQDR